MTSIFGRRIVFFLFVFLICSTSKSLNFNLKIDSLKGKDSTKIKIKLNVGSDIVSRFIWRGCDYGNSPCVQPTLALSKSNFEIGVWGSIATNSFYKEIDLFAKYTFDKVSLTFTDYYVPSVNGTPSSPDTRYFIYDDKKTSHYFEGSLLYKGGEKLPLWLLGGVFFYGNDKRWGCNTVKDSTCQTYYSSYFEAGYTFIIDENSVDLFLGFTPAGGAFGNTMGVVNIGASGVRKIKITKDFELPIKTSLIFNPQTSNAFFVLGITI